MSQDPGYLCRGKLLNVRDASVTQINGNAEINAIKQILGLQHGKAGLLRASLPGAMASLHCIPVSSGVCSGISVCVLCTPWSSYTTSS